MSSLTSILRKIINLDSILPKTRIRSYKLCLYIHYKMYREVLGIILIFFILENCYQGFQN